MSEITHDNIARFTQDKINLPPETVKKHRQQVNLLRERLEAKIAEDSAFDLIKMLHAGSVARAVYKSRARMALGWTRKKRP